MSTLDYAPVLNGAPYDPAPAGGQVLNLALFDLADRSGTAAYNSGLPAIAGPGLYRFTINDAMAGPGRYWLRVQWTSEAAGPVRDDDLLEPLDLPIRDDMVVSPESLAVQLGVPLPVSAPLRATLTGAILDAQTDVEAYLGRPIVPQVITERRMFPPGGWALTQQPVLEVLTEAEVLDAQGWPTGYWDVTYRGGLDARFDPRLRAVRRVVLAQAAQADAVYQLWASSGSGAVTDGTGRKQVRSVSAESQSVSYDIARPGGASPDGAGGSVGGPVRWAAIDSWRLRGRRVFQRSNGYGGVASIRPGR